MRRKISTERKAAYYIGRVVSIVGVVLFLSTFFTVATSFRRIDGPGDVFYLVLVRGFGGMILIFAGTVISGIGSRGLAGSGIVLDPEQAAEDLEPWARTGGKLIGDAIAEIKRDGDNDDDEPEIKVRCHACKALNDEDARFCDQCGAEM